MLQTTQLRTLSYHLCQRVETNFHKKRLKQITKKTAFFYVHNKSVTILIILVHSNKISLYNYGSNHIIIQVSYQPIFVKAVKNILGSKLICSFEKV